MRSFAARPDRPEPPEGLSPIESEIWKGIVGAMPATWFGPETFPVLRRLCGVEAAARVVAARITFEEGRIQRGELASLSMTLEKLSTSCLRLSRELKLTPASRGRTSRIADHKQTAPKRKPWEVDDAS
jgi:hypothetical protein